MSEKSELSNDIGVSDFYSKWIKAVSEVRIVSYRNDSITMDPEKIKEVTITVPAWAASDMYHKCRSCGWPVYIVKSASGHSLYCTNPECCYCKSFDPIVFQLQGQDRIIQLRKDRARAKKIEREKRAQEERKQDQIIEDRVRRILLSFGIKVRKTQKRAKT